MHALHLSSFTLNSRRIVMTFNTNRPQMRALPCNVPATTTVKVYPTEFYDHRRGVHREQWQATFRPADARDLRDLVKVVVNFYLEDAPNAGDVWEVEMLHRAPKVDIVFANAVRLVESAAPKAATAEVVVKDEPLQSTPNRAVCAWLARLPKKLAELRAHFRG
jgi:hypothetical protein